MDKVRIDEDGFVTVEVAGVWKKQVCVQPDIAEYCGKSCIACQEASQQIINKADGAVLRTDRILVVGCLNQPMAYPVDDGGVVRPEMGVIIPSNPGRQN